MSAFRSRINVHKCSIKDITWCKALRVNYLDDLSLKCSWVIITEVASWNELTTLTYCTHNDTAFNERDVH